MRQDVRLACLAMLALGVAAPALADIAPLPPPPGRPDGPQRATVRGLDVEQTYVRGRWRSWMTQVISCSPEQRGCDAGGPESCYVAAVGGTRLRGGDIAGLQGAIAAAGARPVRLNLTGCRLNEITLMP